MNPIRLIFALAAILPALAVANLYSDNVTVLLNNGNGTFGTPANYGAGDSPTSVFSNDFDGDGDNDLAVANTHSANVSVLLNNGDGTFADTVNNGSEDISILLNTSK
jgi:hypothetical protein